MHTREHSLVRLIARIAPWLAPLPNAYLVGRATIAHLAFPLPMAIVAGAILELLGIATVHTALTLYAWNLQPAVNRPRGAWQRAPTPFALAGTSAYFLSVIFLSLLLDTHPQLAIYAPALFPLVAAVGALTLALISQHDARVSRYCAPRAPAQRAQRGAQAGAQRSAQGSAQTSAHELPKPVHFDAQETSPGSAQMDALGAIHAHQRAQRGARLDQLVHIYAQDPHTPVSDAARALGIHRNTVYNYLDDLEDAGRIHRHNGTIAVAHPHPVNSLNPVKDSGGS